MTETPTGDAVTLAKGTLSFDYLNSVLLTYASPSVGYAIASQRQSVTLNSGLGQAAAAANLTASAFPDAAYVARLGVVRDRESIGADRRGSKRPITSKPSGALSDREKACLSWIALGKSSWEIGRILSISENTVIFHIKNAMRKLGTGNRTLAAVRALQLGLIEPAVTYEVLRQASAS